jgi:predicted dehydrogenase
MSENRKHTLVVVNPGHFHAALTLRKRHALLSDEVYVYAEDGPDLNDFLRLVASFNQREREPTSWELHLYRGPDYLDALLRQPPGDVAIVAGKNDSKLATIHRLHEAGLHVLGDKTWLIGADRLDLLDSITAAPPLAMDIMTERFEVATRLQQALSTDSEVFGGFRDTGSEPAVYFRSVHHLYKEVNGEPLVRPAWYFDTAVQGEGITDVTTHLVDLAQWMIAGEQGADYARDVVLAAARQWPTDIPSDIFFRITALDAFPDAARRDVSEGVLHYLCNAKINYALRGVPVEVDSIWDLAIPAGGGDTHFGILRGKHADLIVDQGPDTGFETRLRVVPTRNSGTFESVLANALGAARDICPGTGYRPLEEGYEVTIPAAMHHGHEARFAEVLDQFLGYVSAGKWPLRVSQELVTKYTLLAHAYLLSHR